jgi:hypothetical protein
MSGTVGFLGTGFAFRSESFQKTFRGYGIPPKGWPTHKNRPAQGPPKGAKKVKTRVVRAGKLMVIEPDEVVDGDEVLGDEIEYVALPPGWDYEVEAEEDDEFLALDAGMGELVAAPYGELGYGVAGYLEAGEAG